MLFCEHLLFDEPIKKKHFADLVFYFWIFKIKIFVIFSIHKPSLGLIELPQKVWARSDKQSIYIDEKFPHPFWSEYFSTSWGENILHKLASFSALTSKWESSIVFNKIYSQINKYTTLYLPNERECRCLRFLPGLLG